MLGDGYALLVLITLIGQGHHPPHPCALVYPFHLQPHFDRIGDNTEVISHCDFNFLLSMVDGFQLHLGYEVIVFISYQGIDPRIGTLFVGPYIMSLVRRLGILEGTNRKRIVGGIAFMTIETLRSMEMLQRVLTRRGAEY